MRLEDDLNIPVSWKEWLASYCWNEGRDIPWNPDMRVNDSVVQGNEITFDSVRRTMRLPPDCIFVVMRHRVLDEVHQFIRLPDALWYYLSTDHLVHCSYLPFGFEHMDRIGGW